MRRQDFVLLGSISVLILALLVPAWIKPSLALSNFGDLYAYHYPLRHLAASAFIAGRLPFWNPYIFSGLPLAANPQLALFYPVSALGRILPLGLALSWDFAFHLLWAAWGWGLLARRQGLDALGATLLAVCYALSPFLIYRVEEGIPTLLASLSWAPWAWLAWLSGSAPLLAAAWSLQFFSGHPQFMVINALAMTAWASVGSRRRELIVRMFQAGCATLALTAAQWLPLREFLAHSVRKGWPLAYTTAYSVDLASLASVFYPNAVGNPLDGTYAGPPSVFFETACLSIGLLGAALAACGLLKSRRKAAALVLLWIGLALASGGNNRLYLALLHTPLGWLRTPSRYLFLCLWGLILAAGGGWRVVASRFKPRASIKALFVLAAIMELTAWDRRFLKTQDSRPYLSSNRSVAAELAGRDFRIMTDPDLASPDKAILYRAMNVNGYEAFYLGGYPDYAAKSEGKAAADASRTYLRRYDSPQMDRLGVRYFLSAQGKLSENPAAFPLVYFLDAQGRPGRGQARLSIERPERWRVQGIIPDGASAIVVSQPLYPGWRARLDGRPVALESWDGWLQSLRLPQGGPGRVFDLALDFEPTGWAWYVLISVLAWSALMMRMTEGNGAIPKGMGRTP